MTEKKDDLFDCDQLTSKLQILQNIRHEEENKQIRLLDNGDVGSTKDFDIDSENKL